MLRSGHLGKELRRLELSRGAGEREKEREGGRAGGREGGREGEIKNLAGLVTCGNLWEVPIPEALISSKSMRVLAMQTRTLNNFAPPVQFTSTC